MKTNQKLRMEGYLKYYQDRMSESQQVESEIDEIVSYTFRPKLDHDFDYVGYVVDNKPQEVDMKLEEDLLTTYPAHIQPSLFDPPELVTNYRELMSDFYTDYIAGALNEALSGYLGDYSDWSVGISDVPVPVPYMDMSSHIKGPDYEVDVLGSNWGYSQVTITVPEIGKYFNVHVTDNENVVEVYDLETDEVLDTVIVDLGSA